MKYYTDDQIKKKLNKINMIRKIVKLITYPIIVFILSACVCIIIQKKVEPNEIPNLFGYKMFSITSGSMEQTLNVGDLILIKNIENEDELKKGQIITFRSQGTIVTHRIDSIKEEQGKKHYITKGDNNNSIDEESVDFEAIEGIYATKIPKIGYVILKIQNTTVLVSILVVTFIAYSICDKIEERKMARHAIRKQMEDKKK